MSFILDALKKSERERQRKSSPKISDVLLAQGEKAKSRRHPVTILLLTTIIFLLIFALFNSKSFWINDDDQQLTVDFEQNKKTTPQEKKIDIKTEAIQSESKELNNESSEVLDINIANATYNLYLPELHIDIHVFSEVPEERFVFINMKKYNEGDKLIEGPFLNSITEEGAILIQQDITFLLPKN
ncbi:MAG TPA: general secretion pathway protein GspB [Woeseiaceae bacterium]|nr:general secretion pathway protein GspB [Woeseiaceae bacterium]|tara:strand:+ start:15434 stop:15988 length:555 start_codon:yes stop_codon:yes gene_type:complete